VRELAENADTDTADANSIGTEDDAEATASKIQIRLTGRKGE
jgi:hypothetical protein